MSLNITFHKKVTLKYKNWKGEVSVRNIIPFELCYEYNQYHSKDENDLVWCIRAFDLDKQADRHFAINDILEIFGE